MSFSPTLPEQQVVAAIFNSGDPNKLGIINGESAVKILTGAKLPPTTLGEIWAIADSDNNGFLTRKGVAAAVRLIGWAQKGEPVNEDLLNKGASYPHPAVTLLSASPAPQSPSLSSPAVTGTSIPKISATDRAKFIHIFIGCGPQQGLLTGEKARDVFVKSSLPVEKLGQIWNLSDTQLRGALDQTDFIIGMFFIQLAMSQPNLVIPRVLPPGLYEQASGGRPMQTVQSHATGGSSGLRSPKPSSIMSGPIKPQLTGQALRQQVTGQTLTAQHTGQALGSPQPGSRVSFAPTPSSIPSFSPSPMASSFQQPTSGEWAISAQEKATADNFFATLDPQNKGYIEGDTAVPFFLKSNLPEPTLAQIWDLADMSKDGRLTQDGFAVALHLINANLAGKDVPDTLPANLIPPSMRQGTQSTGGQYQQELSLLGDTPPATANNPQYPFAPQATGGQSQPPPTQQPTRIQTAPTKPHNFFDDEESNGFTSPTVPDHSVQIGNVQNQLDSTNRSLNGTKTERVSLESSVASSAATLAQIETQLAAAKAAYETETKLVSDLRIRYTTQTTSINKAREELIRAESELSALRQEKAEIEGSVLRDKEEVRDLQRKMKQVGEETEIIKKDLERVKKDARHQKGLLAINKKQVATAESERDKQEKELEVAQKELELATKEVEDAQAAEQETIANVSRSVASPPATEFAAFPPLPESTVASPSPKSTASRNPFEKLMGSGGASTPKSGSAFLPFAHTPEPVQRQMTGSNEDPFGFATAFAAAPVSTPPPVASQISSPAPVFSPPPRVASPLARSQSPESVGTPEVQSPAAGLADHTQERSSTSVTDEASRFPAIDGTEPQPPTTDLPPLHEIQEHDSDSDSDSETDSDDRPLGIVAAKAKEDKLGSPRPATPPRPKSPAVEPPSTPSAFDSAFGTASTSSAYDTHTPQSPTFDTAPSSMTHSRAPSNVSAPGANHAPFAPFESTSAKAPGPFTPSMETVLEPKTSTVTDFDEAFGTIGAKPNGITSEPAAFKFDDAFGDTFNFGDFGPNSATPTNPALTTTNGHTAVAPSTDLTHSNIIGQDLHVNGGGPAVAATQATPATPTIPGAFSFDDAFGFTPPSKPAGPAASSAAAAPSTPTANREVSDGGSREDSSPPASMSASYASSRPPQSPSPVNNGPSFSLNQSRRSEGLSAAKATSKKDAVRFNSPDTIEQPAPTKSSKFHFPGFGRSKTQKKQKGTPAAAYAPMASDRQASTSSRSPSLIDPTSASVAGGDVEGVKRITEMGFTRDQAVSALEKHAYDLPLALSDLLGEGGSTPR